MVRVTREEMVEYSVLLDDPNDPATIRINTEMPKIMAKLMKSLTAAQHEFERDFYNFTGRRSDWKVQVHHPDFGTKVLPPVFDPEDAPKGNRKERRAAKAVARQGKTEGNPWRQFGLCFDPALTVDGKLLHHVYKMLDIMYEQRGRWDLPDIAGFLELPDEGRILKLVVDIKKRDVHVALMPPDFELPETAPSPFGDVTRH